MNEILFVNDEHWLEKVPISHTPISRDRFADMVNMIYAYTQTKKTKIISPSEIYTILRDNGFIRYVGNDEKYFISTAGKEYIELKNYKTIYLKKEGQLFIIKFLIKRGLQYKKGKIE